MTCDVAVVGGGIVGAACAYELSLAGLRVAVVEPNAVGAGATNLGYGSFSILNLLPGQFALTRYGLKLWEKFVEYLPPDCEYSRCGTIWLASADTEMSEAAVQCEFFNSQGVTAELLDRRQISEAELALSGEVAGGLFLPDDGWLRASRAAEFLFQLALKQGAQHIAQRAVSFHNHELTLQDGSLLYAGNAINALGNDAPLLTPELPVKYSKGHILVVETAAQCAHHQLSALVAERSADAEALTRFVAHQGQPGPNQASEVWIGSSSQPVSGPDASLQVEPKIVAHMLRRAIEMIPAIGQAKPLRSWTGIRMTTLDGLPLIGRISGRDGIFAATAHNAYGATASLATARLIVDELMCQTPEIDPTPYRADRF